MFLPLSSSSFIVFFPKGQLLSLVKYVFLTHMLRFPGSCIPFVPSMLWNAAPMSSPAFPTLTLMFWAETSALPLFTFAHFVCLSILHFINLKHLSFQAFHFPLVVLCSRKLPMGPPLLFQLGERSFLHRWPSYSISSPFISNFLFVPFCLSYFRLELPILLCPNHAQASYSTAALSPSFSQVGGLRIDENLLLSHSQVSFF